MYSHYAHLPTVISRTDQPFIQGQQLQFIMGLSPKLRELVPTNIKALDSLSKFKNAIKLWKLVKSRKTCISLIGFV